MWWRLGPVLLLFAALAAYISALWLTVWPR